MKHRVTDDENPEDLVAENPSQVQRDPRDGVWRETREIISGNLRGRTVLALLDAGLLGGQRETDRDDDMIVRIRQKKSPRIVRGAMAFKPRRTFVVTQVAPDAPRLVSNLN